MIKKRIVKIIIAVAISYLKTNSYEHDDISIDVKNIDSQDDSMIQIDDFVWAREPDKYVVDGNPVALNHNNICVNIWWCN